MSTSVSIYSYVMACLAGCGISRRVIAAESGVPFSTITKIAQGEVKDPSVHTVQKLHDYFRGRGMAPVESEAA